MFFYLANDDSDFAAFFHLIHNVYWSRSRALFDVLNRYMKCICSICMWYFGPKSFMRSHPSINEKVKLIAELDHLSCINEFLLHFTIQLLRLFTKLKTAIRQDCLKVNGEIVSHATHTALRTCKYSSNSTCPFMLVSISLRISCNCSPGTSASPKCCNRYNLGCTEHSQPQGKLNKLQLVTLH